MELDKISAEEFRRCLHQKFVLRIDDESSVEAELVEVRVLESHSRREDRTPFSILFAGPGDAPLPQRIYRLENDTMGELDVFLVTLGPDPDEGGMLYESVFT